jgi:glycogen(starch) synthase
MVGSTAGWTREASDSLSVAIVFGTFPPDRNGGADFVHRFADALAARGIRPHVLTSARGEPASIRLDSGVVVHRVITDWELRRGRKSLRRVADILRRDGVDVVHAFFPDSHLQARYQLVTAVGLGRVPLVTTWWNLGLGRRSPWRLRATSIALVARSRALTSHDPVYLAALRHVSFGRPVTILPVGNNIGDASGVSPAEVRARFGVTGAPLLGFFGHLDFTRGVEDLFASLALIRRSQDVRLLMIGAAGTAEHARYRDIPERLGIADSVVWTGYLEPEEAADALAAVDLCVLPYRRNSVGRSALAAALCLGVPTVLGGSEADVAPLVPDRHVALAPRGDAHALAAVIERLLRDDAARAQLESGAAEAAMLFAWPAIAERAEGIYRSALGARRR